MTDGLRKVFMFPFDKSNSRRKSEILTGQQR